MLELGRMPANNKISSTQREMLVEWMVSHPLQARGTMIVSPQGKQHCQRLWEELASRLNSVGDGTTKTSKEWRLYWSDMKCKVKKKGVAMRQHASGTGGGPSWDGILTQLDDKILSLIGVQNVIGNENVRIEVDMGIDDPLPSSSSLPPLPLATAPSASSSQGIGEEEKPQKTEKEVDSEFSAGQPLPHPPSRPLKRKHVTADPDGFGERSRPQAGPPRWALDLENRRIFEEEKRRELEERRLALEERRLALEERRLEEDKTWRSEVLSILERIASNFSTPPPTPPSF